MSTPPTSNYAGEVDVTAAWAMLKERPDAQLIDVRTRAEWNYVGRPDVGPLGRKLHLVEWQEFPSGAQNAAFVEEVREAVTSAGARTDSPLLFICRSGARSRSAAIAMTKAGYSQAYNVSEGFEGDLDGDRHRGRKNGWKVSGLPWLQT